MLKVPAAELPGVLSEALTVVPAWLLAGLALGVAASLVVAGIFVAGESLFPNPAAATGYRVDGTARRREEIRSFLRAIGEPFEEEYPLFGYTVAFYLPHRDVAITFDAQTYFRLEDAETFVVLCELEMPGAQLGRRLPFDVDESLFSAPPGTDPVADAFAHLGLPRDADVAAVKAAYRSKVIKVHPDQGGDEESFKRLREAYATARNHADA